MSASSALAPAIASRAIGRTRACFVGYGEDELRAAGAFRVYRDAAELLESLDALGIVIRPG